MAAGNGARRPPGWRFVFAVRTTGIYCRPSCPSRRPRRDSVEFYANPNDAERAGYRACLRCKPTEISSQAQYVTQARRLLDNAEGVMTLAELSKRVGLSPFHLQRLFKRATGLSPREYQSARRMQHVKSGLRKGDDVTTALYDAGFGSPSRLYEKSSQQLGMTPGEYRRGGSGATIRYAIAPTPLGRHDGCRDRTRIVRRAFGETVKGSSKISCTRNSTLLNLQSRRRGDAANTLTPLVASIRGDNSSVDLPLDIRATAFQQKVWDSLRRIPRGETRSYTEVAREIGEPTAVRAVARACADQSDCDRRAVSPRRSQRRRAFLATAGASSGRRNCWRGKARDKQTHSSEPGVGVRASY